MRKKTRQRELGFVHWGGKRRGAGRKPSGKRAGVSHAKRAKLAARFPVLVTMKLCDGLRTLRARDANALVRAAIAAGRREDFRVVEGAWRAFAPDAYSSAPWFDGWNCRIEKGAESRSGILERARTWLLSVGWRRHGLIDPLEVPVGAEVYM